MAQFSWVPFYEELADKLLQYKSDRAELIQKVKEAHEEGEVNLPKIEADNDNVPDIDPFTVFALFNRGKQSNSSRQKICEGYKSVFQMNSDIPLDFDGIPVHYFSQYCFYRYVDDPKRDKNCFSYLWTLFEQAIIYSKTKTNAAEFAKAYEQASALTLIGPSKLTIGLFHIRPNTFVSLDAKNNEMIQSELHLSVDNLSGTEYLSLCSSVLDYAKNEPSGSIPKFSYEAYNMSVSASEQWEPTLEEYDPQLTKEDWLRFMRESGKFSDTYQFLLAAIYAMGGAATCTQLGKRFDKAPASFNLTATHFAISVQEFTRCPKRIDSKGDERYWSIPFIGRYTTEEEDGRFVWKLRPELKEAVEEFGLDKYFEKDSPNTNNNKKVDNAMFPKNTILFGPPGTGKTYSSVSYAVAIIENKSLEEVEKEPHEDVMKRYNRLKKAGQIEFTTFHQSYGYEEFIEGIRPIMEDDSEESDGNQDIRYEVKAGLFKAFCDKASSPKLKKAADFQINDNPTVWKVSLEGTYDNPTRTECMENDHIRIGYDSYGEVITDETVFDNGGQRVLNAFINRMQVGDIIFSCYTATTIDAIGVVTGEYEWHDEYPAYKRLRKVRWLARGLNENIVEINAGKTMTLSSAYMLNVSLNNAMELIKKVVPDSDLVETEQERYVFIIDEINRGNISKIFGELITLIESTKRKGQEDAMEVRLPYSHDSFSVPDNVYLLGTMNTADRSIATLDTALRRRFSFREMPPKPEKLSGITVDGLNIETMLSDLNRKIAVLYDREHTIGHSYFLPLAKNPSIETLASIFRNEIIPLLQEYFYEDYEKIRLVLGDNKKDNEAHQFIVARSNDYYSLFGESDMEFDEGFTYEINAEALNHIESYQSI